MPIYFAHRNHFEFPDARYVRIFEGESLLGWFRTLWETVRTTHLEPEVQVRTLFGRNLPGLADLFVSIRASDLAAPENMTQVMDRMRPAFRWQNFQFGANHFQMLLQDRHLQVAYYAFDGHYATEHANRAAYLMTGDWHLPDGGANIPGTLTNIRDVRYSVKGEGCTYVVDLGIHSVSHLGNLDYFPPVRVPGVRVADFPRVLFETERRLQEDPNNEHINYTMRQLAHGLRKYCNHARGDEAAFLNALSANPNDFAGWCAYSDWLEEHRKPPAGQHLMEKVFRYFRPTSGMGVETRQPKKDQTHCGTFVSQVCKHVAREDGLDVYHNISLFDDLWVNAHPQLATSFLRYAHRWDCL